MDTSETYIKMCVKAEEIQKAWKPQGGDYYLHNYRNTTGFSREAEKQIWGDADEKWQTIEILCYKPMEDKDWFVSTADGQSHVTSVADLVRHNCIWLPREDQLQEMVGNYEKCCDVIYEYLDAGVGSDMSPLWEVGLKSFKQLWLAFVQKELYNKVWNGDDWKAR